MNYFKIIYNYSLFFIVFNHWFFVHCLLEDLQEVLGNSISYLNQGLNIIKRAEEFVENSIGEDCEFNLCEKKGLVAQEKSQHIPSSNGCGSLDFLFDDTEDSLIHVEKEFSQCCDEHDFCYDSCGSDKDECDLKFKKCLYATCKSKSKQDKSAFFLDAKKCKLKAKLFYVTVIGVGCQSFIDAQKEACECVRPRSEEL